MLVVVLELVLVVLVVVVVRSRYMQLVTTELIGARDLLLLLLLHFVGEL